MVRLPSAGQTCPVQPLLEELAWARGRQGVAPVFASSSVAAQGSPIMTKRLALSIAAFAIAGLFVADLSPAIAQTAAPSRTPPSSTVPGGPDGGDGGMRSASCGEYGYANMPSGCLTQAMACICPNDSDPNYRSPSSCEGITRNARHAAERKCANNTRAVRRLF